MLKLRNKRVNYMKNLNKNQVPATPFATFLRKIGVWLYIHADTLATHAKNILDIICLFVGLAIFYGLFLIGGAM